MVLIPSLILQKDFIIVFKYSQTKCNKKINSNNKLYSSNSNLIVEINPKTHRNAFDLGVKITSLAPWRVLGIDKCGF